MILDKEHFRNSTMFILDWHIEEIEKQFKEAFDIDKDISVISYTGDIDSVFESAFLDFIELVKSVKQQEPDVILVVLTTPGGSVETAEKMANILRYNYKEVFFLVPDYAMSAGTILCMSGDRIFMDYFSSLGPIDPQVKNQEGFYVPAMGYIDKLNELIEKSKNGTLTDAEYSIFQKQDLGTIHRYEQARELSIDLLIKWLVNFKFKNWEKHSNGQLVTLKDKENRAKEIAEKLADNKKWHSHGRYIGIDRLKELKLVIDDYTNKKELRVAIREYIKLLREYINIINRRIFLHAKL